VAAPARSGFALLVLTLTGSAFGGSVSGRVSIVEKKGGLAQDLSDTVVYLQGVKIGPHPTRATMVMKGKSFMPHVVAIPIGGTVVFPNEDPIFHNVFSLSGDNRFDLDLYKRPKSGSWTFEHPGIARVYCNIHPQMSAVVVVVDSPFFAKAGTDGAFTIEGIPAGSYTLSAWHERGGETSAPVKVSAEGQTHADLVLDASQFKKRPHLDKFGKDYSTHNSGVY
jgi:plastocyanin